MYDVSTLFLSENILQRFTVTEHDKTQTRFFSALVPEKKKKEIRFDFQLSKGDLDTHC